MKNIKLLLLSTLLVGTSSMAMSAKVKEPKLVEGTSVGKYQKPGAPVHIRHTSVHLEAGEVSEVNIVLMPSITSGVMNVKLDVDKSLLVEGKVEDTYAFTLKKAEKEYPITLNVSAQTDGLYYVRLIVTMKDKGMRAFAVPVYVGEGKLKTTKKPIEKSKKGENIIVSPAVETIER
jgi:hypothetical protein